MGLYGAYWRTCQDKNLSVSGVHLKVLCARIIQMTNNLDVNKDWKCIHFINMEFRPELLYGFKWKHTSIPTVVASDCMLKKSFILLGLLLKHIFDTHTCYAPKVFWFLKVQHPLGLVLFKLNKHPFSWHVNPFSLHFMNIHLCPVWPDVCGR